MLAGWLSIFCSFGSLPFDYFYVYFDSLLICTRIAVCVCVFVLNFAQRKRERFQSDQCKVLTLTISYERSLCTAVSFHLTFGISFLYFHSRSMLSLDAVSTIFFSFASIVSCFCISFLSVFFYHCTNLCHSL